MYIFGLGCGPMVEYLPSISNTQDSVLGTEKQKCYNIFNYLSSPSSVNAEGFYVALKCPEMPNLSSKSRLLLSREIKSH